MKYYETIIKTIFFTVRESFNVHKYGVGLYKDLLLSQSINSIKSAIFEVVFL